MPKKISTDAATSIIISLIALYSFVRRKVGKRVLEPQ